MQARSAVPRNVNGIFPVIIKAVAQFGKTFHAAARTAPKFMIPFAEHLKISARHRLKISRHARFGILRRENTVKIRVFVIVDILLFSRYAIKPARKFQHVVYVARFAVAICPFPVEHAVAPEMLPFGIAARRVRMPLRYRAEKDFRNRKIPFRVYPLPRDCFAVQA